MADFQRDSYRWLELARNWILEANQAQILASGNNFQEMRAFLEKIGSDRKIENQTFAVELKSPWNWLKNRGEIGINQNRGEAAAVGENEFALRMWTCGESDPDYLHAMEA